MSGPDDAKARALALRAKVKDLHDRVDAPDGMLFFLTGVALLDHTRKDHDAAMQDRNGELDGIRSVYVLSHEFVHWMQCCTTGFVLWNTLELLRLVGAINRKKKLGQPMSAEEEGIVRDLLGVYDARSPNMGWSVWDLLEAHAVVEGCNGAFSSGNVQGYYAFIRTLYPDPESPYRKLIEAYAKLFGLELGWKLLPEVVWLALNTERPALHFEQFTDQLLHMDHAQFRDTPAASVMAALGAQAFPSLRAVAERSFGDMPPYRLYMAPYMEAIEKLAPRVPLPEMGAHPSAAAKYMLLSPPLVVFTDGDHRWHQFFNQRSDADAALLIDITHVTLDTLRPFLPMR